MLGKRTNEPDFQGEGFEHVRVEMSAQGINGLCLGGKLVHRISLCKKRGSRSIVRKVEMLSRMLFF